jgi:CHAT domain-containing protein
LPLLERVELVHYAGHGLFAGREGWQSALPLAGSGHLAIGDVLTSSAVPARVVLSGCETARSADGAPAESLGLAQSFVVAGADFVIAPVRPVDDKVAARLSAALYGGLAETGVVDAATILRDAQARLRAEMPAADWSAFRVVSR